MGNVVVQAEGVIARPIDVVRAQFVDMAHHASARVHAKLEVADVRPGEGGCRFTGRRRTLGMLQSDDIEVTQRADGSSTLRSVGGSNKGLLITQTFEAVAADRTRVRTTVELPFPGILFFLVPLVRMGLQRDVEAALEEDRVDLEQRGYPRR